MQEGKEQKLEREQERQIELARQIAENHAAAIRRAQEEALARKQREEEIASYKAVQEATENEFRGQQIRKHLTQGPRSGLGSLAFGFVADAEDGNARRPGANGRLASCYPC